MRSVVVVVSEEYLERVEPPAMLLVGLEVAFEFPVRLRPADGIEGLFNLIISEISLEGIVSLAAAIPYVGVKLQAVIGDDLENLALSVSLRTDLVEQLTPAASDRASASIMPKILREATSTARHHCSRLV